ncbi:hypothetical protein L596_000461 [Steinernema carpocapsae]|uniref:Uncharacterized protein n=1 Tax=Steinernema carpocapsae TaxID=34508 RepID=A0A4U8UKK9_STECR|nr:hypothetical protein L596_000461 [Steinernema carpocapsae]
MRDVHLSSLSSSRLSEEPRETRGRTKERRLTVEVRWETKRSQTASASLSCGWKRRLLLRRRSESCRDRSIQEIAAPTDQTSGDKLQ